MFFFKLYYIRCVIYYFILLVRLMFLTSYPLILHHIISYYIMSYYFISYYVRPAGRGQATEGLALQFEHMSSSLEKVREWLLWKYSLQFMLAITLGVYFRMKMTVKKTNNNRKKIKKKYQKRWYEISFIIIIIIIKNFNLSESIDVHTIYCKRWSW